MVGATRLAEPSVTAEGRIFIDRPIQSLVEPYEKYTEAEADRLMSVYLGKWLKVRGEVYQVDKLRISSCHDVIVKIGSVIVTLMFETAWEERVVMLRKGQPIAAIGRLSRVGASHLILEDCEVFKLGSSQEA